MISRQSMSSSCHLFVAKKYFLELIKSIHFCHLFQLSINFSINNVSIENPKIILTFNKYLLVEKFGAYIITVSNVYLYGNIKSSVELCATLEDSLAPSPARSRRATIFFLITGKITLRRRQR